MLAVSVPSCVFPLLLSAFVHSSLSLFCPLYLPPRLPTISFIDLSFQTAARILAAPAVDALNVMKDLSQNFPTKAR